MGQITYLEPLDGQQKDREANCDLTYILDIFSLVTNVSAVQINLPPSLVANDRLQAIARRRVEAMTKQPIFDYESHINGMETMLGTCRGELIN